MTRYFGVHTLEGEWHSLLPRYVLMADRVEGKRVLDIGCGTGIGSSLLREMGAESVNAIDHRPEVLELARVKHAKQGLNFNVMFWEELDFPDDSFDLVLCLDPTSPVTDQSLLLEVQRVLTTGGEYVCAIERRNIDGLESLLPRYGYDSTGEELPLTAPGDWVPQIGHLDEFFDSVVSVVQQPRYSFVFDHARDEEERAMRRRHGSGADESGLWVGDNAKLDEGSAEQTDEHAGRWIGIDQRLCDRDGEPSSVELLFCGDEHMPVPKLREVQMPYRGLVDRLHQLFSELQLRQHPDGQPAGAADATPTNEFAERSQTSEFHPLPQRHTAAPAKSKQSQPSHDPRDVDRTSTGVHHDHPEAGWKQVQAQLEQMTNMYQQVRSEMEDLFVRTRQELVERDRYIEQLVETVHRWRHELADPPPATAQVARSDSSLGDEPVSDFDHEPTQIFKRDEMESGSDTAVAEGEATDGEAQERIDEDAIPTTAVPTADSLDEETSSAVDEESLDTERAEKEPASRDAESTASDPGETDDETRLDSAISAEDKADGTSDLEESSSAAAQDD